MAAAPARAAPRGRRGDATPYGGWIGNGSLVSGHFTGHFLSALSFTAASTGDAEIAATLAEEQAILLKDDETPSWAAIRVKIKGSTWLQRASMRPVLVTIPRRPSSAGLQLSSRPKTSEIGRDLAEI